MEKIISKIQMVILLCLSVSCTADFSGFTSGDNEKKLAGANDAGFGDQPSSYGDQPNTNNITGIGSPDSSGNGNLTDNIIDETGNYESANSELKMPVECLLTNISSTNNVTNKNFVLQLRDSNNQVILATRSGTHAISRGKACDKSENCYELNFPSIALDKKLNDGSFQGDFTLCRISKETIDSTLNQMKCAYNTNLEIQKSPSGIIGYDKLPVDYQVVDGKVEITKYRGMPGSGEDEGSLIVGHRALGFMAHESCSYDNGTTDLVSPLVLDLNKDGALSLVSVDKGVQFDFNGDGLKSTTGWVSPEDGLLAIDLNQNNTIDSGLELLGEFTGTKKSVHKHGFAALKSFDSNGDGVINKMDKKYFKMFRVWQDKNQDGISQKNELSTLKQLKITSLNVGFTKKNTVINKGNAITLFGSYKLNGKKHKMDDVWFKISKKNKGVNNAK